MSGNVIHYQEYLKAFASVECIFGRGGVGSGDAALKYDRLLD